MKQVALSLLTVPFLLANLSGQDAQTPVAAGAQHRPQATAPAPAQTDAQFQACDQFNEGVQAFKAARFAEAVEYFKAAAELDPNLPTPRLYLATAYMEQYIPGADSPENQEMARAAEEQFENVLQQDPKNELAISSIASLCFSQKKLDEAEQWYQKLISVNPAYKEAYYTLGVIAWTQVFPPRMAARARMGMKPEDPGPLTDNNTRAELAVKYGPVVEAAIRNLEAALNLNPEYADAMAYLNLLYREKADLEDTPEAYKEDIESADNWVQKCLDTRKIKADRQIRAGSATAGIIGSVLAASPPRCPSASAGTVATPQRIRVAEKVQAAKLVRQTEPVYPPLAKTARISGQVILNAIIGQDGTVQNLTVESGHPVLIPAAVEAVKGWVYAATLLNGEPVEVVTQVVVNFTLSQ